jgi:hypothetical protein
MAGEQVADVPDVCALMATVANNVRVRRSMLRIADKVLRGPFPLPRKVSNIRKRKEKDSWLPVWV